MRTGAGKNRGDTLGKETMAKSPGLEGRTIGFGPGWAPDYNVTLGLFLLLGPGSPSVKCRSRDG